jgi:hypothetical protein
LCFVSVFFVLFEIVVHGNRRGDMAQTLTRRQHLVALHEAKDALHWAMCPASHCHIRMVIKIASILLAFFVVADHLFAHKLS